MSRWSAGLLLPTTFLFSVGLFDDLRDLRPLTKLACQFAGGLLLYSFGFHVSGDYPPTLDLAIVVFWVVGVTNALNLADNMNGLAAGIALIAGFFRLVFSLQAGNSDAALASAALMGAAGGFLVFNFPRASIFMGDAGSLTLGFALAALSLTHGQASSQSLSAALVFPVLVLAVPIFDTSFVSVVRVLAGRDISRGGRDHVSHRLVAVGLDETRAVLVLCGISAGAGLAAFALSQVGFSYAWFGAALLTLGLVLFGVGLAQVRVPADEDPCAGRDDRWSPDAAAPAELLHRRRALWMILDAATVLLALYGAHLMWYGGGGGWDGPGVIAVSCSAWLMGVYRTGSGAAAWREGASIATSVVVGMAVLALASVSGWLGHPERPVVFLIGSVTVVAALLLTRRIVRATCRLLNVPLDSVAIPQAPTVADVQASSSNVSARVRTF